MMKQIKAKQRERIQWRNKTTVCKIFYLYFIYVCLKMINDNIKTSKPDNQAWQKTPECTICFTCLTDCSKSLKTTSNIQCIILQEKLHKYCLVWISFSKDFGKITNIYIEITQLLFIWVKTLAIKLLVNKEIVKI